MRIYLVVASLFFSVITAHANDSAVEVAAGGLKLRKEQSVLMEKERLFISDKLVRVEYEFRNTSSEPVSSEVAFPIPPFGYVYEEFNGSKDFSDFKAWVNGKPVQVKKEVRAIAKVKDITADLRNLAVPVETFGDYNAGEGTSVFTNMKRVTRARLVRMGALKLIKNADKAEEYSPSWSVALAYHWRQEFPPGETVRIKHEYKPVSGYMPVQVQSYRKQFKDGCVTTETSSEVNNRVAKAMRANPGINNHFGAGWISYILTTANSWQTPIKDFELVIEGKKDELVSFCWDGSVEKSGANRYRMLKTDFVPDKELKVYFFGNF